MLSFGFSGGVFVKQFQQKSGKKGESFSVIPGLMNQFEIVYIIGDENDLVKLRAPIIEKTVSICTRSIHQKRR